MFGVIKLVEDLFAGDKIVLWGCAVKDIGHELLSNFFLFLK